jgi:hypothetical protein
MNDPDLVRFRDFLIVEFNEEQLAALCQDIGLSYADLPGAGAFGKTRELIEIARSRHLLGALMNRTRELRPEAFKIANLKAESDSPAETSPGTAPRNGGATPAGSQGAVPDPLPVPVRATPQEERAALIAALTPRARLLAVLVAVLLLIVAALTIILPKPSLTSNTASANATALAISATNMTAQAQVQPTLAPTVVDTATQAAASTAVITHTQAETATTAADAAAAVRMINDQLVLFYTGQVDSNTIKAHFGAMPYRAVTSFAYTKLKRLIGVDLTKGDALSVTLRYEKDPEQTAASGSNFTVSSTEYWNYTNPKTNRSVCDTSSYVYTLSKNGDVFQVTGLKSAHVSDKCD